MSDRDLPDSVCDYVGIIRDQEIGSALDAGYLISTGTFVHEGIRQASYELRLGRTIERLVLTQADGQPNSVAQYQRPANGIDQILQIRPGETIKVYTIENLDIPNNVVAHVIPVGNVYKLGLSPETTYADPGFDGEFYITLCNYSTRVVELSVGQPIARIEFVKLARSTKRPHPGSRRTSEPPRWPRRVDRRSDGDLRAVGIDELLREIETCDPPHIEQAFVVREVRSKIEGVLKVVQSSQRQSMMYLAQLRLFACAALLWIVVWAVIRLWPFLPDKIQDSVTDWFVSGVLTAIGVAIVLLRKRGREMVKVALGFGR